MSLTLQPPTTLAQSLVSIAQPQVLESQRPKLKMVWHKEWDGKRDRLVAQWVIEP